MSISFRQRPLLIELALLLVCTLTVCQNDLPEFLVEPASMTVAKDSPVNLSCSVRPADAVVRWIYEDQLLADTNSYGFKMHGTQLFVPSINLLERQESVFQCLAETRVGTIISRPATISKAVLQRFEHRKDLHLSVMQGSNLVLPCQPPYSQPPATIMFLFNNTTTIDRDTDHYQILPSGNLLIVKVSAADQGPYRCMAQNKLRQRTRKAMYSIFVDVLHTELPRQEPAVIVVKTKLKATVGENVLLECSAVGNPQPVIRWEKYGGKLIPGRYTQKHGNLYLHNVTVEDEGTYLCKADNGLNTLMPEGLKAMMLEISEPPTVKVNQSMVNVSLAGRIRMECIITGKPKPLLKWYHNSKLLKSATGDVRVVINHAEAGNQGLYQCFAENQAGVAHAEILVNVDVTKRDTSSVQSDQNVTDTPSDEHFLNSDTSAGQKGKRRHERKRKKKPSLREERRRKGKGGLRDLKTVAVKLVPPSKPEVKQLSDTSVMLNWTVPSNEGLRITFFRVQYKKIGSEKGRWETEDVEIKSHVRTFEVGSLQAGATYKFRIAAVYTNNDNTHGPNSERFVMKLDPLPESRPPSNKPTIVEVTPIEYVDKQGLNVKWQLQQNTDVLISSPIEGFYIYYRPYHSQEPFQNVTLLQPSVRAHLLRNLLPGTEYLIKMQSFNAAGNSSFSNEVVEKTKGENKHQTPLSVPPDTKISTSRPPVQPDEESGRGYDTPSATTPQNTSGEMLYMILGIVLGVMMLLLIIFMFMCWWKQRQQRRMMDAMNDAVRNKFQDSSQRLYTDSLRKKMLNGGVAGVNGMNGTIANGHIPRNFHNVNINVNPLSDMETVSQTTDNSNHYSSTFHPNGSVPTHHRTSDNNCNNINQSKSLQSSLQHIREDSACSERETLVGGGGESMASPPSPISANIVPIRHNSDAQDRRSLSSRSCDHGSCELGDSSYDDTGAVHSNRHRKRRRRTHCKEQTTKDQATNTDLSSNDGTMDLAENKAISSSQDSGQMLNTTPPPAVLPNVENNVLLPCSNAV